MMELSTKPDFEKCMDRVEAWWERRIIDRPPVTIGAYSQKPPRQPAARHATLREPQDFCLDFIDDPEGAKVVMDSLRPEGIWLACLFSASQDEARAFLGDVERWAAGKK